MHPIRASVVIYFKVETQWRLGLKVKLDSSLPSLITNPIIYILHMLPGHYLFKLFTTSIIFYPHDLRLCVCVHIYIIWRERERERERDQTITTEYMNAINIHVCARSYVQYIHTNGERNNTRKKEQTITTEYTKCS